MDDEFTLTHAIALFAYGAAVAQHYARKSGERVDINSENNAARRRIRNELRPTSSGLPGADRLQGLTAEGFDTAIREWEARDSECWDRGRSRLLEDLREGRWLALTIEGKTKKPTFWTKNDLNLPAAKGFRFCAAPAARAASVAQQTGHVPPGEGFEAALEKALEVDTELAAVRQAPASPPAPAQATVGGAAAQRPAAVKPKRKSNGDDFRADDAVLGLVMLGMMKAKTARSPEDAARAVVKNALGNGEPASKVKRLAKRYRQAHPDHS